MEQAVTFTVNNMPCLGIIHQPKEAIKVAVLLVVGGPQYRVGSHRQFVQLSRALADNNIASMRFDYRGMGDSQGEKQAFDNIDADIACAIECFTKYLNNDCKIVIWGLCDAASASLMYAAKDSRISGLILLNPWLRNEQAMAQTMVKYYYLQRLLSKAFWKKLLLGRVKVTNSLADAGSFIKQTTKHKKVSEASYQQRMLTGFEQFSGRICLILSGQDLTAREFDQQTVCHQSWRKLRIKPNEVHRLAQADHTFSSLAFKRQVEQISCQFVDNLVQDSD